MTYRQSSFDPNVHEQPGPALRPYNKVQWTGVALGTAGVAYALVWMAGKLGVMQPLLSEAFPGIILCIVGSVLINSRRGPSTQVGSEQLEKNRRVLLITVAILLVVIGTAAALDLAGAF